MKQGLFVFDPNPGVVPPGSITNNELADMAAFTVKGNPTNTTGEPQDIAAASNTTFFGRVSDALGFFGLVPGYVTMATSRLLGRTTGGSGGAEEITVGSGLSLAAGALGIATAGVTNAMLRNSAALSVIGRSANSSGAPADIAAANDGEVLRRSGTALGFGTLAGGAFADNTIALSRLANAALQYNLIGRTTAGSGAWEQKTTSSLIWTILGRSLASDIRTDLGLGTAAVKNTGTSGDAVPLLNISNVWSATQVFQPNGFQGITMRAKATTAPTMIKFETSASVIRYDIQIGDDASGNNWALNYYTAGGIYASTPLSIPSSTGYLVTGLFGGSVRPALDNTYALGTNLTNWSTLFVKAIQNGSDIIIDTDRLLCRRPYTFGTLPSAVGRGGRTAFITDGAAAPVWGANAAGGGAVTTMVSSNGANWLNG